MHYDGACCEQSDELKIADGASFVDAGEMDGEGSARAGSIQRGIRCVVVRGDAVGDLELWSSAVRFGVQPDCH